MDPKTNTESAWKTFEMLSYPFELCVCVCDDGSTAISATNQSSGNVLHQITFYNVCKIRTAKNKTK